MLEVQTKPRKRGYHFFPREPIKLLNKYERWRKVAEILKISKTAKLRLEWIIYHHQGHNATQTARHFGISRKTFHKWLNEFDEDNLYTMYNLEDRSKAPHRVRQRKITPLEEERIVKLRKENIRWGKMKLKKLYEQEHDEEISSWKIQKVIEKKKLYFNPTKTAKIARKRQRSQKRKESLN